MKCSSEMLQNFPYFWNTKTHVDFFHFPFRATLFFPLMNALVYVKCQHRPGHSLGEKVFLVFDVEVCAFT